MTAMKAANPNIDIDAAYYEAGTAYATTIPTQFAGGNGTDLGGRSLNVNEARPKTDRGPRRSQGSRY